MVRIRRLVLLILLTTAAVAWSEQAVVEYVDGDVWIVRAGQSARTRADFGSFLGKGDLIITGSRATAVVSLGVASQVKLREDTEVAMDDLLGAGSVELRRGGVFARVRDTADAAARRFQVTTQTVVAGVRGTEFFVAFGRTIDELPDLWLCVNTGAVDVSVVDTGDVTTVNAGEGINILAGRRATTPRFYPWTLELNWNFDPAQGPIADDADLDGAYSDLLDQDYD